MALFVVNTENDERVVNFVKETKARLNDNNLIKNPFIAEIKSYRLKRGDRLHLIDIRPIYFNFSIFGWLAAIAILLFWGWHPLVLAPAVIVGCLGIFWSKYLYYMGFKYGMKRTGYQGLIQLVNPNEALKLLHFENGAKWDSKKS